MTTARHFLRRGERCLLPADPRAQTSDMRRGCVRFNESKLLHQPVCSNYLQLIHSTCSAFFFWFPTIPCDGLPESTLRPVIRELMIWALDYSCSLVNMLGFVAVPWRMLITKSNETVNVVYVSKQEVHADVTKFVSLSLSLGCCGLGISFRQTAWRDSPWNTKTSLVFNHRACHHSWYLLFAMLEENICNSYLG